MGFQGSFIDCMDGVMFLCNKCHREKESEYGITRLPCHKCKDTPLVMGIVYTNFYGKNYVCQQCKKLERMRKKGFGSFKYGK
jgi:hypothetical protein